MPEQKLWILKSKGAKSAFAGNSGYADELERFYLYDTTVKNHDKIKLGDYVLLVNKHHILGSAEVERIEVVDDVHKQRFRCPECGTQEHYSRQSMSPKYKCRNKHEFDVPNVEDITVTQYRAHYSASFKSAAAKLSVKMLEGIYIKRNIYYSIQQAQPSFITGGLGDESIQREVKQKVSLKRELSLILPANEYVPSGADDRRFSVTRQSIRASQDLFRSNLFKFYGTRCMASGCDVATAIEASHICAFRGEKDNHPQNGILLRRDLHALYDEDLIGIEPNQLRISLSWVIEGSVYEPFDGCLLSFDSALLQPSRAALELRWQAFLSKESGRNC